MSSTVLYMSMSLDGFIAGPNETPDNGLGDGGQRLHDWFFPGADVDGDFEAAVGRLRGVNRQVYDEVMATGAVVAGRGTFEPAGGWGGDNHGGVPIYILSRNPAPEWAADWPLVHYVSDLAAAMGDAKQAAGGKDVLVHGAGIAQRALTAGLLDELEIHLIPVLLGDGRRLFEHLGISGHGISGHGISGHGGSGHGGSGNGGGQHELERVRVLEGEGGVTHLRYRVRR